MELVWGGPWAELKAMLGHGMSRSRLWGTQ